MPLDERQDKAPHINETAQSETAMRPEDQSEFGGRQRSTAPNTSFGTGAGEGAVGYDSPPVGSQWLGNTEVAGVEHADPYFPPGGPADADTTTPDSGARSGEAGRPD